MKKISLLFLSVFCVSVFAKGKDQSIGPAGCGLGNVLFGGKSPKEKQILAATTNGTSANQLFGITSGTLNCVDNSGVAKLEAFIESNKQAFATESARGDGETLQSVAYILSCVKPSAMNEAIRSHHAEIFATDSAAQITENLRSVLSQEQVACFRAG